MLCLRYVFCFSFERLRFACRRLNNEISSLYDYKHFVKARRMATIAVKATHFTNKRLTMVQKEKLQASGYGKTYPVRAKI